MDIRLEDMVLHKSSGLKQQWQFSPWITSHRFQLPLRWYARARLIRHTLMSSATKHLASQRDAHLLLRATRPPAAWPKVSRGSSPRPLTRHWMSYRGRGPSTHPAGEVVGTGRVGSGSSLRRGDSYYQHTAAASCDDWDPSSLRAEARKPLYQKEAVIWSCPLGTNGASVTWTLILTVNPAAGVSFLQALQSQRFIPFIQRFTSDDIRGVLVLAIALIISLSKHSLSLIPWVQFPATLARACFW